MTDLATVLFRLLTGGPWPGRGADDDRIISAWPGLTGLFDEVLTPVPAIDSMTVFAARLRQVWRAAGPMIPLPAAIIGPSIPTPPMVEAPAPAAPAARPRWSAARRRPADR